MKQLWPQPLPDIFNSSLDVGKEHIRLFLGLLNTIVFKVYIDKGIKNKPEEDNNNPYTKEKLCGKGHIPERFCLYQGFHLNGIVQKST